MKVSMGRRAAFVAMALAGLFPTETPLNEMRLEAPKKPEIPKEIQRYASSSMHPAYMTPSQRRRLCPGRDCMSKRRRG